MNNYKDMFILKPTASSCGRGIKVIGKKDQINNKKGGYLVSKYIAKPHLLRGFKYDLRLYIVVTCYEPLKAYLFQDGLVRLATQQYSTNQKTLKKRFVHLTNYSINKKAEAYKKNVTTDLVGAPDENAAEAEQEMSSKWSLK
jgi:tubulin polyglutamylase TTLL4